MGETTSLALYPTHFEEGGREKGREGGMKGERGRGWEEKRGREKKGGRELEGMDLCLIHFGWNNIVLYFLSVASQLASA